MAESAHREPIAIIGVGCRLPGGANDPDSFWRLLLDGRDVVGPVPKDRWDLDGLYHPDYDAPGRIHQRHGGFVDQIAEFDAAFFGMSPKEANRVDPQQRLVLEAAHQALENAGIGPWTLSGSRTGVFVGISTHDYSDIQCAPAEWSLIGPHTNQGGALSIAANRVSYVWNLVGPSVAIDTACSSTLYGLHYALQSLRNGDCDLALLAGVNALLTAGPTVGFSKGSFLSARGRCQAFSAHADGFVRAEGAAVLVLKPLSNALADRDPILAVLRQTAVNEDGRTDGMALPSESAQVALLADAYTRAGIDPGTVGYVEAHGTGTPAGDPIEARAIGAVMGRGRPADRPLLVGSVKTNIGHLEAGAGAASLLKATLAIQHGWVPASLHADELNPAIPFEALRMDVVRSGRAWPAWDPARRAGVNGFGFGGANAHAILEAAPPRPARPRSVPGPVLGTLSARTPEALAALARAHLEQASQPSFDLVDVAYTTAHHRDHHPQRAAIVARDTDEWRARLQRLAEGVEDPHVLVGRSRGEPGRVAFVCSGQGPQWWAMGRQLLAADPVVHGTVEAIDALFHRVAGWSILEALSRDEATSRIDETQIAQPAIFALQLALARRWESLGVRPDAVVGHSVGEVAAAVLAGTLTLDQGVAVIYHRSRIQQKAHGKGKMLAVGLPWDQVAPRIATYANRVSPAAFNRPGLVVLSGDAAPLEALAAQLLKEEVFHKFVAVAVPFHSHHMNPLQAEIDAALGGVAGGPAANCPLYSTVTGDRVAGPELSGNYWYRNVREPVRFVHAIRAMIRDGSRVFVELSPHPILMPGLEDLIAEAGIGGLAVPSMRRDTDEVAFLLAAAGRLYAAGHTVSAARPGRLTAIPNYPWERRHHWTETSAGRAVRLGSTPHPAILAHHPGASDRTRHAFDLRFDPRVDRWLKDHVVQGTIVVPGAALLEATLACARAAFGPDAFLTEVAIERALFAPGEDDVAPPEVRLEIDGDDGRFRMVAREPGAAEWTRHASGRIDHRGGSFPSRDPDLAGTSRCRPVATSDGTYAALAERGLPFGPTFRVMGPLQGAAGLRADAVAPVTQHAATAGSRHLLHPTLLDACFQVPLGAAFAAHGRAFRIYLPVGMEAVRLSGAVPQGALRARCIVHHIDDRSIQADTWLVDEAGTVHAEVIGYEGRALVGSSVASRAEQYEVRWLPEERPDQWPGRLSSERLGAFADARAAVERAEAESRGDPTVAAWSSFEALLAKLALAYAVEALRTLGVDLRAGATVSLPLPGVTGHARMSRRILEALAGAGHLRPAGKGWTVVSAPPRFDLDAIEAECDGHPHKTIDHEVVRRPGRAIASVLRGERSATEVLFGEGSPLPTFYAEGFQFAGPNGLLATALASLVCRAPVDRQIRVLEVGAGTGGLTTRLLPVLPADRTEYVHTDLSLAFSADARERFAAWPFVRFAELDLEREMGPQGYAPGSFDVVAASDVLHATSDLRRSLAQVATVLAPGGVLLLLELTDPQFYNDVMFGLSDGWWSFRDESLRRSSAVISADKWKALLAEAGFDDVVVGRYGGGGPIRQSVFVAHKRAAAKRHPATPPRADRSTVLLVGGNGLATRLRPLVAARGGTARMVSPQDVAPALRSQPVSAVLFLAGADSDPRPPDDLGALHRRTTEPLRQVALAIARAGSLTPPRLVVVTRSAVAAVADDAAVSVAPGMLWGTGRVLASELPQVPLTLVDLSDASDVELDSLVSEALAGTGERDVALRGTRRLVARIDRPAPSDVARPADLATESFCIRVADPGVLDSIALHARERAAPEPGWVEIQVRAAGLNFRDLMLAMGLLSSKAAVQAYGMECSGVVTRCGPGVTGFAPGDEVLAVTFEAFSGFVVTPACLVSRKPARISHAEAATVPIAMYTAWYALVHQARLEPGEHLLVHAATGGVGHAAIQIARLIGAEIHATAGSEWKRNHLRERLGIEHVYDSRSLEFVHQVQQATGGRGVDVILNSLAGAAIPRGIEALAPYGRFVEIGKTDIYDNSRIGLHAFRENLSLFALDLERLARQRPEHLARTTVEPVARHLAEGRLAPLPYEAFHVSRTAEAFQRMSRSKHLGKIVVEVDDRQPVPVHRPPRAFVARGDRTWVVTGGTRGFGHHLARWLVERGARHLALFGSSGKLSDDAARAVDEWRARGIAVQVAAVDTGDRRALDGALRAVRATMAPIGGVIHAAMRLDDGPIENLGPERFDAVLAPKAGGALHLHALTQQDPIESFVLLSSMSEIAGNPGQANYNAANALLASLAWHRRKNGQPATVFNLGAISDVGFVAGHARVQKALEANGLMGNRADDLVEQIAQALADDAVQRAVGTMDWAAALRVAPALTRFAGRVRRATKEAASATDLRSELGALDADGRARRLVPVLQKLVARVASAEASAVSPAEPLTDLGLDSLMVNQISSWLQAELGVSVPPMRLLKGPTIEELALDVAGKIAGTSKAAVAPPAREEHGPNGLLDIHRAVWAEHQALPGGASATYGYALDGKVDPAALERALRALVARHDLLASHFDDRGGPVRRSATTDLALARVDARGWTDALVHAAMCEAALVPFDLAIELPIRATLYERAPDRFTLDLRLHNVACDALTPLVLIDELVALYEADVRGVRPSLPPAPKLDVLAAHERRLRTDSDPLRAWWTEQLAGSDLRLPLRSAERSDRGDWLLRPAIVPLAAGLGDGIGALASEARTNAHAVLLTAWFLALQDELGAEDLVVATTASLRDLPGFGRFVGPAMQFVAVRARLDGQPTFRQALARVSDALAGAFAHRALPLYDLVEELVPAERRAGRPRLGLDANFQLHDADQVGARPRSEGGGVRFAEIAVPDLPVLRRHDLTCGVWHTGGRYSAGLRYNARVLDPDQAGRIATGFAGHLAMAAAGYRARAS